MDTYHFDCDDSDHDYNYYYDKDFDHSLQITITATDISQVRRLVTEYLSAINKNFNVYFERGRVILLYDNGYTPLLWAMQIKRLPIIAMICEYNIEVTMPSYPQLIPLELAVMSCSHASVKKLLQHNIVFESPIFQWAYEGNAEILTLTDFSATDRFGLTLLHYALRNIDFVQHIITQAPWLIDQRDQQHCTPFMMAAANGQLAVLKLLRAAGADVQAVDNEGNNALHLAAVAGEIATLTWLVTEAGLALESQNLYYLTPYLWAAQVGQIDVLKALKELGLNTQTPHQRTNNALHLAILGAGDIPTIQWLIAESDVSDIKAGFVSAARHGQLAVLQALQESGVSLKEEELQAQHILHEVTALPILTTYAWYQAGSESKLQDYVNWIDEFAIDLGYVATLKWLVYDLKLSLESRESEFQKTPFLSAIDSGCLALLQALQAFGADIQVVDVQGNNALHLAIEAKNLVIMKWLIKAGIALECRESQAQRTPFLRAAQSGNVELVRALKTYGAEMGVLDQHGNNAVHLAILSSSSAYPWRSYEEEGVDDALTAKVPEVVVWLLQESGLSLEAKGEHQMTAFLCAAHQGSLEILKLLKDRGSDVQIVDTYGNNALHLAVLGAHTELITWLVQEAALDLECPGRDQKTAFLMAAECGSLPVLKVLCALGASPHPLDSMGRDALTLIDTQSRLCYEKKNAVMIWLLGEVYANNSCYPKLRLIGELVSEPDKPIEALVTLLTRHRVLETLILSSNHLAIENMNRLIACLVHCENLTHLDISQNYLTRLQLAELGAALIANKHLQYLSLANNEIADDGLDAILQQGLATHPGIRSLAIHHNKLTMDGMARLVNALHENTILEELYLDVTLTAATFELLRPLLKESMQHIMFDAQLVEDSVECLTKACVIDKRLECLSLYCQELTDQQVGRLTPWLVQQLHLKTLHIVRPQLTKVGIGILMDISQGWRNLYELKLGLPIRVETFASLLGIIQGIPFLKELILYGQCNFWHELQPFMIELIQTTCLKKLDFQGVELKTLPDPTIFEAVLKILPDQVYLEEMILPYTLILTAKQEQELQALLERNREMAPNIAQQRIGARRIKSVATNRVASDAALLSTNPSNLFFASNLGEKRLSQWVSPENEEKPIAKRHKAVSP